MGSRLFTNNVKIDILKILKDLSNMPPSIIAQLKATKSEHVINAIEYVKINGFPPENDSKKYHLIHNGLPYPQKYIASLSTKYASGKQLMPNEFSASQSLPILRDLGFTIEEKLIGCGLN